MPLQRIAIWRNWRLAAHLPRLWHRVACHLVGIRVSTEGAPAGPPLLIAANHVSWLDIVVLGSLLPVSFIAKSEVGGWPAIRTLARLQRTIFVDRTRRAQTGRATEAIAGRVGDGDVMVLFAEGTTGDGNEVLPFRSALLGAAGKAAGAGMTAVQPVAIAYTAIGGIPLSRADKPRIAWYGDMDLVPHFVELAGRGAIDVAVRFGRPIPFGAGADRKKVAEAAFRAVTAMVADIRAGRPSSLGHASPLFSGKAKGGKGEPMPVPEAIAEGPGDRVTSRVS
jgi:lyso-ornithine lipid O-acyltransferase